MEERVMMIIYRHIEKIDLATARRDVEQLMSTLEAMAESLANDEAGRSEG